MELLPFTGRGKDPQNSTQLPKTARPCLTWKVRAFRRVALKPPISCAHTTSLADKDVGRDSGPHATHARSGQSRQLRSHRPTFDQSKRWPSYRSNSLSSQEKSIDVAQPKTAHTSPNRPLRGALWDGFTRMNVPQGEIFAGRPTGVGPIPITNTIIRVS